MRELVALDRLVDHVGSQVENLALRIFVFVLERLEQLLQVVLLVGDSMVKGCPVETLVHRCLQKPVQVVKIRSEL